MHIYIYICIYICIAIDVYMNICEIVCAYKYTSTFQSGGDTYIPVAPASLTDTSIEMSTTEVMFLIWILAVVDQVEPWQ